MKLWVGALAALVMLVIVWLAVRSSVDDVSSPSMPVQRAPTSALDLESPSAPSREDQSAVAAERTRVEPDAVRGVTSNLRVRCVEAVTRRPLPELRVLFVPDDAPFPFEPIEVDGNAGRVGEVPLTDAAGEVELLLATGTGGRLSVRAPGMHGEMRVAPLGRDETRVVELAVATGPDVVFVGRVVDAETAAPLTDAEIDLGEGREKLRVDADGWFQLSGTSWDPAHAWARAPDHVAKPFAVTAGHATRAHALVLHLDRNAVLEVRLIDAAQPVPAAMITVTLVQSAVVETDLVHESTDGARTVWQVKTDADGRAEFTSLPPRRPLRLLMKAPEQLPREHGARPRLEPGERRVLEIRLDALAKISGRVVDSSGTPVPRVVVSRTNPRESAATFFGQSITAVESTLTDESGRFRFPHVSAGSWLVGPGPVAASEPDQVAGLAQGVELEEGAHAEIELRVHRDLFLSGRVVDAEGRPASGGRVQARSVDHVGSDEIVADRDGTFRIGPLSAGRWTLRASAARDALSESELVTVEAGATQVELRLRLGGRIGGIVCSARSRETRPGDVSLLGSAGFETRTIATSADGRFEFTSCPPGRYALVARTAAGEWGTQRGLELSGGTTRDDIVIAVTEGALLSLCARTAAEFSTCRIEVEGVPIDSLTMAAYMPRRVVVPAGPVSVHWRIGGTSRDHVDVLELEWGEVRELAWDGAP